MYRKCSFKIADLLTNYNNVTYKVNDTHYRALGPELSPAYRQSTRMWLQVIHPAVGCQYFPPGLRLPSQPQIITAPWPLPSYTAWWQVWTPCPRLQRSFAPSRIWTHDLLIASPTLYPLRHQISWSKNLTKNNRGSKQRNRIVRSSF